MAAGIGCLLQFAEILKIACSARFIGQINSGLVTYMIKWLRMLLIMSYLVSPHWFRTVLGSIVSNGIGVELGGWLYQTLVRQNALSM